MALSKHTALRTCASCEWIWKLKDTDVMEACPKCGFGSYGARYVYGDAAYLYHRTQKPYKDKKVFALTWQIDTEALAAYEDSRSNTL